MLNTRISTIRFSVSGVVVIVVMIRISKKGIHSRWDAIPSQDIILTQGDHLN